jgi:hypothetical protein
VDVPVAVDVVDGDTGIIEPLQLRSHLEVDLFRCRLSVPLQESPQAEKAVPESTAGINEQRYLGRTRQTMACRQVQMESDPQVRTSRNDGTDGVVERGAVRQQARAGQDPVFMRCPDRVVRRLANREIVGVDDQTSLRIGMR